MTERIPWLTRTLSDGQTLTLQLNKDEVVIGRDPSADLVFDTLSLSRRHACIYRRASYWYLLDLSSRNGTFLNGEPVREQPLQVRDGSVILLGGEVALRFHDPRETMERAKVGRLEGIWLDADTQDVWVDARRVELPLSPQQYLLLQRLYQTPGKVISRTEIIAAVWPQVDPDGVSGEAIDGLIKRLRARLRQAQPKREYIEVLRGHGVRLINPE